jgi:hypothetical protein
MKVFLICMSTQALLSSISCTFSFFDHLSACLYVTGLQLHYQLTYALMLPCASVALDI